jgi:hypothetical protein
MCVFFQSGRQIQLVIFDQLQKAYKKTFEKQNRLFDMKLEGYEIEKKDYDERLQT